jgi:hypothetical protein
MTCCEEPVETIEWLSVCVQCDVAYLLAEHPNPQPHDDLLYKDSV